MSEFDADIDGYHFISCLPRSGATPLVALLRQNPTVPTNITSPVGAVLNAMLSEMSAGNESAIFFTRAQREAMLRGLFPNYYDPLKAGRTVFDTNRMWTGRIELLAQLFPQSKMICCVRHIPWILDPVERLIRRNTFELSKIFTFEVGGTVYSRAEGGACRNSTRPGSASLRRRKRTESHDSQGFSIGRPPGLGSAVHS